MLKFANVGMKGKTAKVLAHLKEKGSISIWEAIELYGDNIMDVDHIIPPMYMSTSATKKAEDYKVNIFGRYVAPLMKKWIQGQENVTADWDEYVSQLNALGLQEYIRIYQEAYDNISK